MTYVEFFDREASENVTACLTYAPDRVIYIGDNSKLMKKHIACYQRVFADRGDDIQFLYRTVSKRKLESVIELLSEIVETYDDCVFDITGGEEILTLALGAVYAKYPNKNIQIHKFNLRNNTIYDCDMDGTTIYQQTPTLSIDENIRIYGGDVAYGGIWDEKTYKWDLNPEFIEDVGRIWEICKENVRRWNGQISVFEAAEKAGCISADGLTASISRADLDRYLTQHSGRYKKEREIISYLCKHGLLTYYDDEGGTNLTVSYKNEQVKKCLTKAGQALEMKVYVMASGVTEKDGVPVYDDALNGVVIDWDGEFHDEQTEDVYDTQNEIDVLLMHDVVPVFISCKNGYFTSDELYKLNTVAERFGGQYSKKVLVATAMESLGEAAEYLRQRAKDMNIRLIENLQELDDEAFAKAMRSLWSN